MNFIIYGWNFCSKLSHSNLNLARKRGPVDMLVKRNAGPEHQKNGMHRLDSA